MKSSHFAMLAIVCGGAAGPSHAWPVDVYADVPEGGHRIERIAPPTWVHVQDPSVATAEVLPTGELLLEAKSPGSTLLVGYADGRHGFWRIRVGKVVVDRPAREAALGTAKKACPKLELEPERGIALRGVVKDDGCRRALRELFRTDGFIAKEVELTFEVAAMQAQLVAIQRAFTAAGLTGLAARYVGAGLVLTGTATPADHRRALLELFDQAVGRVALDDQVEEPERK